jgi:hypothetical protein
MTETGVVQQRRWIALLLLCVAELIAVLDASIVNLALPTMGLAPVLAHLARASGVEPARGASEPI